MTDILVENVEGDYNDTNNMNRGVEIRAEGSQEGTYSVIDLSSLDTFDDQNGWTDATEHDRQMSQLKAINGGHIELGSLKYLHKVELLLDGSGTLNLDSLTSAISCRLTVSADVSFPNLTSLYLTFLYVDGVTADFSYVTDIRCVPEMHATGGGRILIPQATNFNGVPDWTLDNNWTATGAGSEIDLSGLEVIRCGTYYDCDIRIKAIDGGRIDLSSVTDVLVENVEGDHHDTNNRNRSIEIRAEGSQDGTHSLIDLSSLEGLMDEHGWAESTEHDGQMSQLKAVNEGEILLGSLTHLNRVEMQLDGTGTMDLSTLEWAYVCRWDISSDVTFPNLWRMDHAYLYVNGATASFPAATNIDWIPEMHATGGGRILIPQATSFEGAPTWTMDHNWTATGEGSLIALSGLEVIHCGTYYDSDMTIQAVDGGRIEMPNVTTIDVPGTGDQRKCGVHITASTGNGVTSVVDLSGLESFVDYYGWTNATEHDGQMSQLKAFAGTEILLGEAETVLSNVETNVTGTFGGSLRLAGNSTLVGSGEVTGSLSMTGSSILYPGGSGIGSLDILGDYTQSSGARLETQLAGTDPTAYDRLVVGGTATLAGGLAVSLAAGFFPADADPFEIVAAASRTGTFDSYAGLDLGAGTELSPEYSAGGVTLSTQFSTGPEIESADPAAEVINELTHIDVTFSEIIAPASFTLDDVTLTGPGGAVTVSSLQPTGDRSFRLTFPRQTLQGDYVLQIGPNVTDLVGNPMNQDGDGINGEAYVDETDPGDVFVHTVGLVDQLGPVVTGISPVGVVNHDVEVIRVTFSEPISEGTFAGVDVLLTGPQGVVPAAQIGVTPVTGQVFDVTFPVQSTEGTYLLEIGPNIEDISGNDMAGTGDGTPIAGTGQWTLLPNGSFESGTLANWVVQNDWRGAFDVSTEEVFLRRLRR